MKNSMIDSKGRINLNVIMENNTISVIGFQNYCQLVNQFSFDIHEKKVFQRYKNEVQ